MYAQFLTFEYLKREYLDNRRGCTDIALEIGCSATLVLDYLKKFNIPRRSRIEAISKKSERKLAKKQTQTLREKLLKLEQLEKLVAEVEELEEIQKALRGEESSYYVSESEAEHNRQVAHGKARAERYRQMQEDLEWEKRRGGGGKWHVGDVNDQLYDIMEQQGEGR